MKKDGITLTSIVLYVILFFIFSTFAIMMSTNMNYKTLAAKGDIWINEQKSKLEYNLLKSAKSSNRIDCINGKIAFSNGDEYLYDVSSKRVLKNGGVVAMDVENFSIIDIIVLKNTTNSIISNRDTSIEDLCVEFELKKYGKQKVTQLYITMGDDSNENT